MSYKSCITSGFYVFIDCQIRELTEGMGREHKHYQNKSPKRNPGPQLDLSIFLESFSKLLCFSFVRFSMLRYTSLCTPPVVLCMASFHFCVILGFLTLLPSLHTFVYSYGMCCMPRASHTCAKKILCSELHVLYVECISSLV